MADETVPPGGSERHGLAERLSHRRREHLKRGRAYRIAFAAAGVIVTLAGVAMLALPGPALAVIPIGLAMLAMEFDWAERLLHRALVHAEEAQRRAKETTRTQRALVALAVALGIAAFVYAAIRWDIPLVPFI